MSILFSIFDSLATIPSTVAHGGLLTKEVASDISCGFKSIPYDISKSLSDKEIEEYEEFDEMVAELQNALDTASSGLSEQEVGDLVNENLVTDIITVSRSGETVEVVDERGSVGTCTQEPEVTTTVEDKPESTEVSQKVNEQISERVDDVDEINITLEVDGLTKKDIDKLGKELRQKEQIIKRLKEMANDLFDKVDMPESNYIEFIHIVLSEATTEYICKLNNSADEMDVTYSNELQAVLTETLNKIVQEPKYKKVYLDILSDIDKKNKDSLDEKVGFLESVHKAKEVAENGMYLFTPIIRATETTQDANGQLPPVPEQ